MDESAYIIAQRALDEITKKPWSSKPLRTIFDFIHGEDKSQSQQEHYLVPQRFSLNSDVLFPVDKLPPTLSVTRLFDEYSQARRRISNMNEQYWVVMQA